MTDTTTTPVTEPGPPPALPEGVDRPDGAFFAWVRGLGITRTHGWLGGVCGGLAARMGIDPIIVRGMFVVAALIGFPALLIYAIAWALLPDLDRRIPLQQLGRGRFQPALIAIAIMVVLSFALLPWAWQTVLWPIGAVWLPYGATGLAQIMTTVLVVALVGGIIALIIWLAVRASSRSRGGPDPRTASADPAPGSLSDTAADLAVAAPGPAPEPPASTLVDPDADAGAVVDSDEVAAWRVRQEEWRAQRDAWRRQQAEADAAARERARREREATGRAFAAEVEARRIARRTANPRASAVLVLSVLGAALVAGAIGALAASGRGPAIAATAGLLIAALVGAVGMIVAGAFRRRSGFLAFATAVLLAVGVTAGAVTVPGNLRIGSWGVSGQHLEGQHYLQPVGDTTVWVSPYPGADEGFSLRKGTGWTEISVSPGVTLDLDARLGAGEVSFVRLDADEQVIGSGPVPPVGTVQGATAYRWVLENPDPDAPSVTVPVHIEQNSGEIRVVVREARQ